MPLNFNLKEDHLIQVPLAPGFGCAILPEDWPILNMEDAADARYVYCGRSMNAAKYGVPPMVVYFSPVSYWDTPARDAECDHMDSLFTQYSKACENAYLHHQVTEKWITDESGRSVCLNREEWAESFFLFHDGLPVDGAKLPYCDDSIYKAFHGAHIVRPDGYGYEDEDRVAQVSPENNWEGIYR